VAAAASALWITMDAANSPRITVNAMGQVGQVLGRAPSTTRVPAADDFLAALRPGRGGRVVSLPSVKAAAATRDLPPRFPLNSLAPYPTLCRS
jgi:hypothetical protein